MDSDPALHQHYRNLQPHIQPNLQSQHTQHSQHHPQHFQHQQHQNHHPPHGQQHQQHAPQHQQHSPHQQYALQNGLDLSSLVNEEYHHDPREYNQDPTRLHSHTSSVQAQALLKGVDAPFYHQQSHTPFEGQHGGQHRHMQHEHQGTPHTPDQQQQPQQTHPNLRPYPPAFMHAEAQHNGIVQEAQDDVFQPSPSLDGHNEEGHVVIAPNGPSPQIEEKKDENRKSRVEQAGVGHTSPPLVLNPPNLEAWRQRLFDVNEMITLSEEEYYTYFPHIDNVYSHRSTQKYKRKPFVSHYWDCRLKGRPPGTPKSDDPRKKKRKRTARERDLCDVKIKITEFFDGAGPLAGGGATDGDSVQHDNGQQHEQAQPQRGQHLPQHAEADQSNSDFFPSSHPQQQQPPHSFRPPPSQQPHPPLPFQLPRPHPGRHGARYFTIQRVNGNGGNGKGDGVAGPHKHTLEESDKVKKNSVMRWMAREGKGPRKPTGALRVGGMAENIKKATGPAMNTVKKHSRALPKDNERGVVFLGDCTDINTQRVWIALEVLNIPYQYVETSPNSAISDLSDVCAKPETPAIKKGDWAIGEAGAILEYLNEVAEHEHTMIEAIAAASGTSTNAAKKATGVGGIPARRAAVRTASLPNPQLQPPPDTSSQNAIQLGLVMESAVPWAGATATVQPHATRSLLPNAPADRAYARQWAAFVDSTIVPAYEAYLRSSSGDRRTGEGTCMQNGHQFVPGPIYESLKNSIVRLIAAAHPVGPFFAGKKISLVDVVFAPLVMRLKWLLSNRGWQEPEAGSRWAGWVDAIEGCEEVGRTCCGAEAYEQVLAEERERIEKESEMKRRRSNGDAI